MHPHEEFAELIRQRINLECDLIEWSGDTINFHFDTEEKWERVFNGMLGLYDAVFKAFSLGFTTYVFVKYDGVQTVTNQNFWIPKQTRRTNRDGLKDARDWRNLL